MVIRLSGHQVVAIKASGYQVAWFTAILLSTVRCPVDCILVI
ncbi:MAG: hypothetical protein NTX52_08495 [Planctomycetota bacterium]|nr:hypothetical protein [Planctomycetota bacterium]